MRKMHHSKHKKRMPVKRGGDLGETWAVFAKDGGGGITASL